MKRSWLAFILAFTAAPAFADPSSVADGQVLTANLAADLASQASATAVLQQWCADRQLADPAVIVAERQTGEDKPASPEVRKLLQAPQGELIRYRRVALTCGKRVLSRADNWYRPGQLTPAMNDALDTTDTPFGTVVRPLQFHRESLEAKVLIKPDAVRTPTEIIRNKALLETPDGVPFSLVVETYSRAVLDFGPEERTPRPIKLREPRQPRTKVIVVEEEGVSPASPPRHHRERSASRASRSNSEPRERSSGSSSRSKRR